MSFSARVFRVLIASPSDVEAEREIAVSTIQAWNDLNSAERQIVLLPLRWETHSSPEYGRRPQEVINRQIVDHSDLLVGAFWTRIGSPTGAADSGTLEEIERIAGQGKPVMLYFSQVKQDPDHIDLDQLQKLREFKKKTFPKALIETYSTHIEFRDKLAKQLEIQLRTLLAEENQAGEQTALQLPPHTEIQFEFADQKSGSRAGHQIDVQTTLLLVEDSDNVPDYPIDARPKKDAEEHDYIFQTMRNNKDYYRDMVAYLIRSNFYRPLRFWMMNVGGLGARDVYVDIRVISDGKRITLNSLRETGLSPPSTSGLVLPRYLYNDAFDASATDPEKIGDEFTTKFEIRALQPQREVSPPMTVAIGAYHSSVINITARIYADTLAKPVTRDLQINWTVNEVKRKAKDLLAEAGISLTTKSA